MNDIIIEKKLCNSNDIPDDSMKEFELDVSDQAGEDKTVKVLLVKQHNRFYCIAPKCSHYSVPLVNGVVYKNRIRCFAHVSIIAVIYLFYSFLIRIRLSIRALASILERAILRTSQESTACPDTTSSSIINKTFS